MQTIMKSIRTWAVAKRIPIGEWIESSNMVIISNEGQSAIALVPRWKDWGASLEDGTSLEEGKIYKIIIEVEGK